MSTSSRLETSGDFAEVRGGQIFHRVIGTGPTMLLMHGGLGHDHTTLRTHDALADRLKLVYYDHRGNGRSTCDSLEGVDHAQWHDDAADLLDYLGDDRTIVYGHSYGAWLALGFALRHPHRVRALVVCSVAPCFDYPDDVMARVAAAPPTTAAAFAQLFSVPPATDVEMHDGWLSVFPMYVHGDVATYHGAFADVRYSAAGYTAGVACIPTYDVLDRLPTLRVPTLVLTGTHDFITPPSQGRRTADAIPGAEFVEFADSGHYPFLEQPVQYLASIRSWLDRCGVATG